MPLRSIGVRIDVVAQAEMGRASGGALPLRAQGMDRGSPMTWVEILPACVGVAYLVASAGYLYQGATGMGIAYAAYAVANVGLIVAAVEGR